MAESHVITGLVPKWAELSGQIEYHQKHLKRIKTDMASLDAAIKVISPDYDLRSIRPKHFLSLFLIRWRQLQAQQRLMPKQATDFSIILESLREQGFNDYKVAELTDINRTVLSKLRTGDRKQPNYVAGAANMDIYQREVVDRNCRRWTPFASQGTTKYPI